MPITGGRCDGGTAVTQSTTNADATWYTIFDASVHGGPCKQIQIRSTTYDSDIRVTPCHNKPDGTLAIARLYSGTPVTFASNDSNMTGNLTKVEVRCGGGTSNSPTWNWCVTAT